MPDKKQLSGHATLHLPKPEPNPVLIAWMQRDQADHKRLFDKLDTMDVKISDISTSLAGLKVKASILWGALSAVTTAIIYLLMN